VLDVVFRAPRAVVGGGEGPRAVGVRNGAIVAVEPFDAPLDATREEVLGDDVVLLPGLVDTHVHVNEPGRTEWEGFETATRAAAAGGVTTIVDMPLNSIPPTTTVEALRIKRKAAEGAVHVDTGFWGGAVPGNQGDLRALHEAGVFGFKSFLLHSGVDDFPPLSPEELAEVLPLLASVGALLVVHAEDARTIDRAPDAGGRDYARFLASRPREAENVAVARIAGLARSAGARVHVVHLSSADALPVIAAARRDGVAITAETCPHYLSFAAEEIPDGATEFMCCPPIREAANRELLWEGLRDGVLGCVVSDHSPCPPELKRLDVGDFGAAWGGIASLQLGLPAVWTGARRRGFALADVVRWMAEGPAALAGLARKGRIAVGNDADLVVFAPDEATVVDPRRLFHRHPVTPYAGRRLDGAVRSTWLRGREVGTDGEPRGALLSRGAT
jgi:allantoinase